MHRAIRHLQGAAPLLAAALLLLSSPVRAGNGYVTDYDYPGQGADWYGRSEGTIARYDYPPLLLDYLASGDDFGWGYDPLFDRLGFGPPLARTQLYHTEYDFRFGPAAAACRDGVDDDGDGLVDFPADPGCVSPDDPGERQAGGPACDDGLDNDGDGLADFPADPGCTSPSDDGERERSGPACDDGLDDDGDGLADYPADPGCDSPFDNDERNPSGFACDNGRDDDGDGLIDYPADPGCDGPADASEADIVSLSLDATGLFWLDVPGVAGYDVVAGDLATLRSRGLTAGVNLCLANDLPANSVGDPRLPAAGAGFFYMARPVYPSINGTYDTQTSGQVAPRDAAIAASPAACP